MDGILEKIQAFSPFQIGSLCSLSVLTAMWIFQKRKLSLNPNENVVVITGCDSGFGFMLANKLSAMGYLVIAGCLTQEGVDRLAHIVAMVILCDVTKDTDIAALTIVTENYMKVNKVRLWALVNNAGIAPCGHLDWISSASHRKTMEVNYFGTANVIQSMLQLLKQTKHSRIINVSSAAGIAGFPNGGPYCASKHAVEGLAKCLRQELRPWNVFVANINPGFMRTPLLVASHQAALREFRTAPAHITAQYSESSLEGLNAMIQRLQENPEKVVSAIVDNIQYASPSLFNPVGYQGHVVNLVSMVPHFIYHRIEDLLNLLSGNPVKPEALKRIQKY